MYVKIDNIFFEDVKCTLSHGRIGHNITMGANPVMSIYPLDACRGVIDFPVFV